MQWLNGALFCLGGSGELGYRGILAEIDDFYFWISLVY